MNNELVQPIPDAVKEINAVKKKVGPSKTKVAVKKEVGPSKMQVVVKRKSEKELAAARKRVKPKLEGETRRKLLEQQRDLESAGRGREADLQALLAAFLIIGSLDL